MAAAIPNADAFARNSRRVILPSLNISVSFSNVVKIILLSPAKQPGSGLFGRVLNSSYYLVFAFLRMPFKNIYQMGILKRIHPLSFLVHFFHFCIRFFHNSA